jgi:hypothetical protein
MPDKDFEIARLEASDRLGMMFARTIILLNGGAFVVLLAYLGGASEESQFSLSISGITRALYAFLLALAAMLIALLISYVRYAVPPQFSLGAWLSAKIVHVNFSMACVAVFGFVYGVIVLINSASLNTP